MNSSPLFLVLVYKNVPSFKVMDIFKALSIASLKICKTILGGDFQRL